MKTIAYKNLTRGNWSLKQNGVVVGHCTSLSLYGVKPHVGGSYDRVRAAKTREVFAWLVGDLCSVEGFESYKGRTAVVDGGRLDSDLCDRKVTFHPFDEVKRNFFWVDSDEDFVGCEAALFTADGEVLCS